jgi:hypothetical protein
MMSLFFVLLLMFIFAIMAMLVYEMTTPASYTPMTFDEEVKWLMEEHKLTRKEAEDLANM